MFKREIDLCSNIFSLNWSLCTLTLQNILNLNALDNYYNTQSKRAHYTVMPLWTWHVCLGKNTHINVQLFYQLVDYNDRYSTENDSNNSISTGLLVSIHNRTTNHYKSLFYFLKRTKQQTTLMTRLRVSH